MVEQESRNRMKEGRVWPPATTSDVTMNKDDRGKNSFHWRESVRERFSQRAMDERGTVQPLEIHEEDSAHCVYAL